MNLTLNSFQKALEITLEFEGGYSNHSADPGGATNHGVTQPTYNEYRALARLTSQSVKLITDSEVKDLYYNLFWRRASCHLLPEELAILHFDTAVNFGCTGANRQLQEAVGAFRDGIIGKKTLALISQKATEDIIKNYLHIRERHYKNDANFSVFGEGWLNRLNSLKSSLNPMQTQTTQTQTLYIHTPTWLKTSYAQAIDLPGTDKVWLKEEDQIPIAEATLEYGHYRLKLKTPILGKIDWYCYADFCEIKGISPQNSTVNLSALKGNFEAVGYDQIKKDLAIQIQTDLIRLKLLDPPADGKFGPISAQALEEFQDLVVPSEKGYVGSDTLDKLSNLGYLPVCDSLALDESLASKVIRYMVKRKYYISLGERRYNIVYVEGMNKNGSLNNDMPNHFNDLRLVIEIVNAKSSIIGSWEATTEPGRHYTLNPMNKKGAARIKFGQYKAWRVGRHGRSKPHRALIQTGLVSVHRDFNKDFKRTGDKLDTGYFGINQHNGYDLPTNNIYYASAGCLVGRTVKGHNDFMRLVCRDKRYKVNNKYQFYTTIIPGDDLIREG